MFTEENLKKIEELKSKFPTTQSLTLPALWLAQRQFGWISPETMQYVADLLNLPVSHIFGVVTFYTMFNTKPVGKYHLQVCTNISCQLLGGEEIRDHICDKLKVKLGETTSDNRFTVEEVECLGSCGTAPAMQVNEYYMENITMETLDRFLEESR